MDLKSLFPEKYLSFYQDKKQQVLIGAFVIVVVLVLVVLYFGFWSSPPPAGPAVFPSGAGQEVRIERAIEKIDFDVDFLGASQFQDLKLYGQWPLEVGEKGKPNPFSF